MPERLALQKTKSLRSGKSVPGKEAVTLSIERDGVDDQQAWREEELKEELYPEDMYKFNVFSDNC